MEPVFICGENHNDNEISYDLNIDLATFLGTKLIDLGYYPVSPQKNEEAYLDADIVWEPIGMLADGALWLMEQCDIVFMAPNWHESPTAIMIHDRAIELHKTIYYDLQNVPRIRQEPANG